MDNIIKDNKLVQYKGGGYDGCIWEYNYCYYDNDGNWHDIAHSGRIGCKSEVEWLEFKNNNKLDNDYYVFNIDQSGIDAMSKYTGMEGILGVVKALNKDVNYDLQIKCSDCGRYTDTDDIVLDGIHGCGGIAVTADKALCSECFSSTHCSYCGSYCESNEFDDNCMCYACQISTRLDRIYELKTIALQFGDEESIKRIKLMDRLYAEIQAIEERADE